MQQFDIAAPGLVKISLPVETLDAARPALEDLRLWDDAGNELPFLITRPVPSAKAVQSARSFQVSLNASTTVITLETGLAQPLDGVTLESPAANFIKAVRVDGSADGQNWQRLSVVGVLAGLAKLLLAIVRVGSAHLFASDRTVAALDSNTDLHASLRSDFLCRRQASTFVGSGM